MSSYLEVLGHGTATTVCLREELPQLRTSRPLGNIRNNLCRAWLGELLVIFNRKAPTLIYLTHRWFSTRFPGAIFADLRLVDFSFRRFLLISSKNFVRYSYRLD